MPGIDAILGKSFGTSWMVGQQRMAIVVEIANQRHAATHLVQPRADVRDRSCTFIPVHRDADQL